MSQPIIPSIDPLLDQGRIALSERRFLDAERAFKAVLAKVPDHQEASRGLETIEFQRIADAEQDGSVDWQQQYAAGPDESIDQPPPLSSDLFDTASADSSVDGLDVDLSESGQHVSSESQRSDGNPSVDPMKWSLARISGSTMDVSPAQAPQRMPSKGRAAPVASFAQAAQKASLIAPPSKPTAAPVRQEGSSTPVPQYSFNEIQASPRSVDTFDDEVDEANQSVMSMLQMADRRHNAGDFSGSMELVYSILEQEPEHPIAGALADLNRRELLHVYRARIGDMAGLPRLQLRQSEFMWQRLSHTEGFVLSQIDGETSYSDIVEIVGMGEFECLEILARLLELGIIG